MPPKKKEEPPPGPNETEVRQSAVIASTFANLELQTTKKTLHQYVELYNALRSENQRLQQEIADRDVDNIKVVRHLRDELDRKNDEIKRLQKQGEEELMNVQRRFNTERKQLVAEVEERDGSIAQLKQTVEELNADLDALNAFRRERQEMHIEMSRFKDRQKEETARYEAELSRLRFQSLEEKVRLKAEERAMSEKFDEAVNVRAMELLDGRTREIHSENFILLQDKTLLERELESVTSEGKSLREKLGEQRRDADLSRSAEGELLHKSAKQRRRIADLDAKVASLEGQLRSVVEEYEIKIAQQDKALSSQLATLHSERDQAYRNAEQRHRDLVKMRQLARTMLQQRSDLETFFNEALEYVRSQIVAERASHLHAKSAPPLTLTGAKKRRPSDLCGAGGQGTKGGKPAESRHPFFHDTGGFEQIALLTNASSSSQAAAAAAAAAATPAEAGGGSRGSLPPISTSNARNGGSAQGGSSNSGTTPAGKPHQQQQQQQQRHGHRVDGEELGAAVTDEGGVGSAPAFATDISHLSWGDKERVLRILFAKINSKAQARRDMQPQQQQQQQLSMCPSPPFPAIANHAASARDGTFLTSGSGAGNVAP